MNFLALNHVMSVFNFIPKVICLKTAGPGVAEL